MLKQLKSLLKAIPFVNKVHKYGLKGVLQRKLRRALRDIYIFDCQTKPCSRHLVKLVLGAGSSGGGCRQILGLPGSRYESWLITDIWSLDITSERDWQRVFRETKVDRILADMVLEHLTNEQLGNFLRHSRAYLAPGGFVRIAAPDGFTQISSISTT